MTEIVIFEDDPLGEYFRDVGCSEETMESETKSMAMNLGLIYNKIKDYVISLWDSHLDDEDDANAYWLTVTSRQALKKPSFLSHLVKDTSWGLGLASLAFPFLMGISQKKVSWRMKGLMWMSVGYGVLQCTKTLRFVMRRYVMGRLLDDFTSFDRCIHAKMKVLADIQQSMSSWIHSKRVHWSSVRVKEAVKDVHAMMHRFIQDMRMEDQEALRESVSESLGSIRHDGSLRDELKGMLRECTIERLLFLLRSPSVFEVIRMSLSQRKLTEKVEKRWVRFDVCDQSDVESEEEGEERKRRSAFMLVKQQVMRMVYQLDVMDEVVSDENESRKLFEVISREISTLSSFMILQRPVFIRETLEERSWDVNEDVVECDPEEDLIVDDVPVPECLRIYEGDALPLKPEKLSREDRIALQYRKREERKREEAMVTLRLHFMDELKQAVQHRPTP